MNCPASEAMYFDGAPLAHVAAYRQVQRQERQAEIARRFQDRRS